MCVCVCVYIYIAYIIYIYIYIYIYTYINTGDTYIYIYTYNIGNIYIYIYIYLDEVAPVAHSDMKELVRRYSPADPRERLHTSVISVKRDLVKCQKRPSKVSC